MSPLSVLAFLALAVCAQSVPYGMGAGVMYPPMMGVKPMMAMRKGPMMGAPGMRQSHDTERENDLVLSCRADFKDPQGNVANAIAVTIESKASSSMDNFHSMMGMGPMGMPGMGGMYGGFAMKSQFNNHHGMNSKSGGGLKARIELVSNVNQGKGFIVFTKRARVIDGCKAENFGKVLLEHADHEMMGNKMGMMSPKMAMMSPKMAMMGGKYGMMGPAMGMGKMYGMGMGGLGAMGMGKMYGMGMGYGMGYGMRQGGMGMYGQQHQENEEGKGVVAEINVIPGALTTAVIDNLEFDDLEDLAGRGVVVCSELSFDFDWNPTCEEPYYSCCSLAYDNKSASLQD